MIRLVSFYLILFVATPTWAQEVKDIYRNNKAIKALDSDSLLEAFEIMQFALGESPNSILLKLNMAALYLENKELEAAKAIYEELAEILAKNEQKDSEGLKQIEYVVRFNLATILTAEKKNKEAIKQYQEALNIFPWDKAAKINIELLSQRNQSQNQGEGDSQEQDSEQDQKDKKDNKGDQDQPKEDQKQEQDSSNKNEEKPRPKKQNFKENELSKQEVKQIFEELKRQEEKIRAKMQEGQAKERELEKDW